MVLYLVITPNKRKPKVVCMMKIRLPVLSISFFKVCSIFVFHEVFLKINIHKLYPDEPKLTNLILVHNSCQWFDTIAIN